MVGLNISPLLATFAVDWNQFGAVFWLAVAVGVISAFLVSPVSRLPVRFRSRLLLALPFVMLLGCLFTRWLNSPSAASLGHRQFYRFYLAELDAAFCAYVAFGAAFSVGVLRSKERHRQVMGGLFILIFLALVGAVYWYTNPSDARRFVSIRVIRGQLPPLRADWGATFRLAIQEPAVVDSEKGAWQRKTCDPNDPNCRAGIYEPAAV